MQPYDAIELLATLLEQEGAVVERDDDDLRGSAPPAAVLRAFSAMARTPVDEPMERHGGTVRVGDDKDADLLLHESGLGGREDDRFVVYLTRQSSFDDARGEYAGMNGLTVELAADGLPPGRVPQAQRWGYAGRHRPDVSDEAHPEIQGWAGYVDRWASAVAASNSWKTLEALGATGFTAIQSDM